MSYKHIITYYYNKLYHDSAIMHVIHDIIRMYITGLCYIKYGNYSKLGCKSCNMWSNKILISDQTVTTGFCRSVLIFKFQLSLFCCQWPASTQWVKMCKKKIFQHQSMSEAILRVAWSFAFIILPYLFWPQYSTWAFPKRNQAKLVQVCEIWIFIYTT